MTNDPLARLRRRTLPRVCVAIGVILIVGLSIYLLRVRKPPTDSPEADRLSSEAIQAATQNDRGEALRLFMAGLKVARNSGADVSAARILNNLYVNVYGPTDPKSRECLEEALRLYGKHYTPRDNRITSLIALAYSELSLVYATQAGNMPGHTARQDYEAAVACTLQAIDYFERLQSLQPVQRDQLKTTLQNGDEAFFRIGSTEEPAPYVDRLTQIHKRWDTPLGLAHFNYNLGLDYCASQQIEAAYSRYLLALPELRKQTSYPDRVITAGLYNNIGSILAGWGQLEEAGWHFQEAIDLGRKLEIAQGAPRNPHETLARDTLLTTFYCNKGGLGLMQNRPDEAEPLLCRAMQIQESQKSDDPSASVEMALCRINLSVACMARRKWPEADNLLARAMSEPGPRLNDQIAGYALTNRGIIRLFRQKPREALPFLEQALPRLRRQGEPLQIVRNLTALGSALDDVGRFKEAEIALSQAMELYEVAAGRVPDPHTLGALRATIIDPYKAYALLLHHQNRALDALAVLDRGRVQALSRQLALNRSTQRLLTFNDRKRQRELEDEFFAAERRLRESEAKVTGIAGTATADRRMPEASAGEDLLRLREEARERLHRYTAELWQRVSAPRPLWRASPPVAADLTNLARRNADTLFLQWSVVDENRTLLLALGDRDGARSFILSSGRDALARRMNAWHRAILSEAQLGDANTPASGREKARRLSGGEPQQAREAYRLLLKPLERAGMLAHGRYRRLAIVGDGPLLDLPYTALLEVTGQRLIASFAISERLSLIPLMDSPRRPETPGGGRAVFVTNPSDRGALALAGGGIRSVSKLFRDAVVLEGSEAKETTVKHWMSQSSLLVFAVHGRFNAQNGLLSTLDLVPEPPGHSEDGRLEAWEVATSHGSVRLAELWACESGLGQPSAGEGLLGFVWAFHAANCPSVVASLWNVDETATTQLLTEFHTNLRTRGSRVDDALREAMLSLMNKRDSRLIKPFYWASFRAFGDMSPLAPDIDAKR